MPGSDPTDYSEFFSDYVAECEEHLTTAQRILLNAELAPGRIGREQLDELFRNFHTVKGLSGMVGVAAAERLAHALESYLGLVRKGETQLSTDGVELLLDGAGQLEAIVAAQQAGSEAPNVGSLITRIDALMRHPSESVNAPPENPSASTAKNPDSQQSEKQQKATAAIGAGAAVWEVSFTPSQELAQQGVTVDTVRQRLQNVGEILHAEVDTSKGAGLSFTFLVSSRVDRFTSEVVGPGVTVERFAATIQSPVFTESAPSHKSVSLVRVEMSRLDALMRTVGELVVTRARLENTLTGVLPNIPPRERRELQQVTHTFERQLRDLREGVVRARLVPVRDLFARMRLVVRDLAREAAKTVDFQIHGEETQLDKFVVERLTDPLLHLVRNAVSHGLESTSERMAAGKPGKGRIDLRAKSEGGMVLIEVQDDGRGIDADSVAAAARTSGLLDPGVTVEESSLLDLICIAGLSTRTTADRVSGRGVGMDVVRKSVERLGGNIGLTTRPNEGTLFSLRLPLTLAIADAFVVVVDKAKYAVPQASVAEVIQLDQFTTAAEGAELVRIRDAVLPVVRLARIFHGVESTKPQTALVVGSGRQAVALAVDRVIGLREIVVHPLSDPFVQVPGFAGATELGDGKAVLILDTAALARVSRAGVASASTRRRTT